MIKTIFHRKGIKIITVILILILGLLVYVHFENTAIQTNEISIYDSKIPPSFDGYKIVQISDLHNAEFGKENENLVNKVKEANPDAIFITGDLIDSNRTNIDLATHFVNEIIKIAPIYFVTGNHEAWISNYSDLEESLRSAGVVILDNEAVLIEKNSEVINLVGLQDPSFAHSTADTSEILKRYMESVTVDKSNYTILLSHRPETFNWYVSEKINLIFSGHAHGGQFRLPFIGGIVAPDQGMFPKYTAGVFEEGETKMIVSRGLGNSVIPFRINNRPELVVVTLKHE